MLLIPSTQFFIHKPEDLKTLSVEIKNFIFENLEKGLIFLIIPEDLFLLEIKSNDSKRHIKNYKNGFLYDALTIMYPSYSKEEKHKIISNKYHMFFTYRQFKSVLDEYNENKNAYLENRNNLQFIE